MESQRLFFEDVATAMDFWRHKAAVCLAGEDDDLRWTEHPELFRRVAEVLGNHGVSSTDIEPVMEELVRGVAVSIMVVLDGGTRMAEQAQIRIADDNGNLMGAFREGFVAHLFDSDRLV